MPVIIAVLGLLAAAGVWYWRVRTAAEMSRELADVAADVRAAARRFGFRRRTDIHPAESLDDPRVAIAGLALAYLELAGLPTAEQRAAALRALQSHTGQSLPEAEEALILGRWLIGECNGPAPAVPRLARRLAKLDRKGSFQPLMAVLKDVAAADGGATSSRQADALEEIQRAFGLS